MQTQTLALSPERAPFEAAIGNWSHTLTLVGDVLEEWLNVQRLWLWLSPLFQSPDLAVHLPTEAKRFNTVDRHWRRTMASAVATPAKGGTPPQGRPVIEFCNSAKLFDKFQESGRLVYHMHSTPFPNPLLLSPYLPRFLEMVQQGLRQYLETKRSMFPRFYFLSDDELLQVRCHSSLNVPRSSPRSSWLCPPDFESNPSDYACSVSLEQVLPWNKAHSIPITAPSIPRQYAACAPAIIIPRQVPETNFQRP